jgi:hypothetical protein
MLSLSALRVSPRVFATAGRLIGGHCLSVSRADRSRPRCTRPIALKVSLKLTVAAAVTFGIKHAVAGRRAATQCVAATRHNRKARRCTRLLVLPARITRQGHAGPNSFLVTHAPLGAGRLPPDRQAERERTGRTASHRLVQGRAMRPRRLLATVARLRRALPVPSAVASYRRSLTATAAVVLGSAAWVSSAHAADRLYWSNSDGVISYANLDGSGAGDLHITGVPVNNPAGIALDPAADRIYWANSPGSKISYAYLDGSGGHDLPITGVPVMVPSGIALDPAAGKVYWANAFGGRSRTPTSTGRAPATSTRARRRCTSQRGSQSTRGRAGSTGATR